MRFIQFLVTFALVTVRAAASPTVLSNPELPTEGAEALSSILAPHDPNKAATTSVSSDQSSATQQIHANNSESTVPPVTTGQPAPDLPSLSIPELPISSGSQTAQHSEPTLNVLSSSSTEKQPIEYTGKLPRILRQALLPILQTSRRPSPTYSPHLAPATGSNPSRKTSTSSQKALKIS